MEALHCLLCNRAAIAPLSCPRDPGSPHRPRQEPGRRTIGRERLRSRRLPRKPRGCPVKHVSRTHESAGRARRRTGQPLFYSDRTSRAFDLFAVVVSSPALKPTYVAHELVGARPSIATLAFAPRQRPLSQECLQSGRTTELPPPGQGDGVRLPAVSSDHRSGGLRPSGAEKEDLPPPNRPVRFSSATCPLLISARSTSRLRPSTPCLCLCCISHVAPSESCDGRPPRLREQTRHRVPCPRDGARHHHPIHPAGVGAGIESGGDTPRASASVGALPPR